MQFRSNFPHVANAIRVGAGNVSLVNYGLHSLGCKTLGGIVRFYRDFLGKSLGCLALYAFCLQKRRQAV